MQQSQNMATVASVVIHPSQFPEAVQRELTASLERRAVNHKFHYDSVKQTRKWLAVHQAFSPSRTDPNCADIYDQAFAAAAKSISAEAVCLIGLGCGGGQKDTRFLKQLSQSTAQLAYVPADVSVAMTLVARDAAQVVVPGERCHPFVCDFALADDLPEVLGKLVPAGHARVITFLGMIPNFPPQLILSRLAGLLRPQDSLIFSANLAPGPDYVQGIQHILPLYDNQLTREWLVAFLYELGADEADGKARFVIEDCPEGTALKRIAAYFDFTRACTLKVEDREFAFAAGDSIRLFFSYRHTPEHVAGLLVGHGLKVEQQWVTQSEEEGVFLCRRV